MDHREKIIELLAQTLAPRLYQLHGKRPENEGFPIYDTEEEVDEHLGRMFDPIVYWLKKGREIGAAIVRIAEAGGFNPQTADLDAMCKAAAYERPDISTDGKQSSFDELVSAP